MSSKVGDEITYPFPNSNGCTVGVWKLIVIFTTHVMYNVCNYLSMIGLKLNHVSKMGPGMSNQSYKSHNAPVPHPTMHYFGKEMCTSLFRSGVLWDTVQVHCGLCAICQLHPCVIMWRTTSSFKGLCIVAWGEMKNSVWNQQNGIFGTQLCLWWTTECIPLLG